MIAPLARLDSDDGLTDVISFCLIFIIGTTNDRTDLEAQNYSPIPVISICLILIIGTHNDAATVN